MSSIKSGTIHHFEQFSQFSSLKEFNHHIEMWMVEHKPVFSKGELIGLKRLVRYAAKIPGVCNAKIGTILKAIHQEYHDNGISRSTFKRMILKAKKLGLLTVFETERKNGSQSSNLYQFNRFPSYEPPKAETMDPPLETSNLLKTEKNQKTKERIDEPVKLDHTYVSNRVPQPFVQLVKWFFNDTKTIEEYWKMAKITAYRNSLENDPEIILEVAIESFKQLIRKLKLAQTIQNPFAYFYGITENKFCCLFHQKMQEEFDLNDNEIKFRVV